MPCVAHGVKSNKIAVQQGCEDRFPHRQNPIDFTAGKWCMQKEPDLDLHAGLLRYFTKELREKHQVVIVNPDRIAIMQLRGDHFGKEEVNFIVSIPYSLANTAHFMQLIMKEWPQSGIYSETVSISIRMTLWHSIRRRVGLPVNL